MKILSRKSPSKNRILPSLLSLILIALFAFSCSEDQDAEVIEDNAKNLIEVLNSYDEDQAARGKRPKFSILSVALAQTGLAGTVASNELTIFAPTDEVFEANGITKQNVADIPGIVDILLYHVVEGKVFSTDLSNGFVPTLNGAAVEVNLEGGVFINNASVVTADVRARNGVIHIIDNILFPPSNNIVEEAKTYNPNQFNLIIAAAEYAGLGGTLANGGSFTVFVPTDEAFVALLNELEVTALTDLAPETVAAVLQYHVVSGRVFSSDLQTGPVSTLNGDFNIDLSTLKITDANERMSGLIPELLNIQATNGVIHVIDRVLLPEL